MGDCLSYGAAKESRARLIYVGEDFARTDVNDDV
jgi:ribonuclease VapC